MAEKTVKPDESKVEVSEEFIGRIKDFIETEVMVSIKEIIYRWRGYFPDNYTRNDVRLRVIRALDIMNERNQIATPFGISREDSERSLICLA